MYLAFLYFLLLWISHIETTMFSQANIKTMVLRKMIAYDKTLDFDLKGHLMGIGNKNLKSQPRKQITYSNLLSLTSRDKIKGFPEGKIQIFEKGPNRYIVYQMKRDSNNQYTIKSTKYTFLRVKDKNGKPVIVPYKKKEVLHQLNPILNVASSKKMVDEFIKTNIPNLEKTVKSYDFTVKLSIISYADKDGNFRKSYYGIKVPLKLEHVSNMVERIVTDSMKKMEIKLKANVDTENRVGMIEVSRVKIPDLNVNYKPGIDGPDGRKSMAFLIDPSLDASPTFLTQDLYSNIDGGRRTQLLAPVPADQKVLLQEKIAKLKNHNVREFEKPKYDLYPPETVAPKAPLQTFPTLALSGGSTFYLIGAGHYGARQDINSIRNLNETTDFYF